MHTYEATTAVSNPEQGGVKEALPINRPPKITGQPKEWILKGFLLLYTVCSFQISSTQTC